MVTRSSPRPVPRTSSLGRSLRAPPAHPAAAQHKQDRQNHRLRRPEPAASSDALRGAPAVCALEPIPRSFSVGGRSVVGVSVNSRCIDRSTVVRACLCGIVFETQCCATEVNGSGGRPVHLVTTQVQVFESGLDVDCRLGYSQLVSASVARCPVAAEPFMRLQVSSAVPGADGAVGMRGLVSYHWESALGDTPITLADRLGELASGQRRAGRGRQGGGRQSRKSWATSMVRSRLRRHRGCGHSCSRMRSAACPGRPP